MANCTEPHVAAWAKDDSSFVVVDRRGGLDVYDARGAIVAQTWADPCVTMPKGVSPGQLVFTAPHETVFLLHEEGVQHVVPGQRHVKVFFSFPKLAGLLAPRPNGGAVHASTRLDRADSGPYTIVQHGEDGLKVNDEPVVVEGKLLALGPAGRLVRRENGTFLETMRGETMRGETMRAETHDVSAVGEIRAAWLLPDNALVYVAARKRQLVAGVRGAREAVLGPLADWKKRGGAADARLDPAGTLHVALFGSEKHPALLAAIAPDGPLQRREVPPARLIAFSTRGDRAVVAGPDGDAVRDVASWEVRFPLDPARVEADLAAAEAARADAAPTDDPRVLLTRRIRAAAADGFSPYHAAKVIERLDALDAAAFAREAPLVELALEHEGTRHDAVSFLLAQLFGRTDLDDRLRHAALSQVVDGLMTPIKATEQLTAGADLLPRPAVSLASAHSVLVAAVRAVMPAASLARPPHDGGPTPAIGARGWSHLAATLARRLERYLDEHDDERAAFDEALATAALEAPPAFPDALAKKAKRASVPLLLAQSAWKEAHIAKRRPDMVGGSLRPAVAKAAKLVLEREGKDATVAFFEALDAELLRLDLIHAAREKVGREIALERTLARGVDGKNVACWLGRLADGGYALLWKEGRRWTWTEGERDAVLGTIPDAYFEAAVRAAK